MGLREHIFVSPAEEAATPHDGPLYDMVKHCVGWIRNSANQYLYMVRSFGFFVYLITHPLIFASAWMNMTKNMMKWREPRRGRGRRWGWWRRNSFFIEFPEAICRRRRHFKFKFCVTEEKSDKILHSSTVKIHVFLPRCKCKEVCSNCCFFSVLVVGKSCGSFVSNQC